MPLPAGDSMIIFSFAAHNERRKILYDSALLYWFNANRVGSLLYSAEINQSWINGSHSYVMWQGGRLVERAYSRIRLCSPLRSGVIANHACRKTGNSRFVAMGAW